jgi:hypothetical protein
MHQIYNIKNFGFASLPWHLIDEATCKKLLCDDPKMVKFIPLRLLTQELLEQVAQINYNIIKYIPYCFRTEIMCKLAIQKDIEMFEYIPYHILTDSFINDIQQVALIIASKDNKYEKLITPSLCIFCIKCDIKYMRFIPVRMLTYEIYLAAVQHGYNIEKVPIDMRSAELCTFAAANTKISDYDKEECEPLYSYNILENICYFLACVPFKYISKRLIIVLLTKVLYDKK